MLQNQIKQNRTMVGLILFSPILLKLVPVLELVVKLFHNIIPQQPVLCYLDPTIIVQSYGGGLFPRRRGLDTVITNDPESLLSQAQCDTRHSTCGMVCRPHRLTDKSRWRDRPRGFHTSRCLSTDIFMMIIQLENSKNQMNVKITRPTSQYSPCN